MSEGQVFPVPQAWRERARINEAGYEAAWARLETDPEGYWRSLGQRLAWIKPFTAVKDVSFERKNFHIRWYADGVLNACANCLDRHLPKRANEAAIIWEGDNPAECRTITYGEAHAAVCKMANVLKAHGVAKGDIVTIYLPMIPEAVFAMLACARIGAPHSVIFGGFSPDSIAGRIADCGSSFVITADEGLRGGRKVPLKANVDEALASCPGVRRVLVVARTGADCPMQAGGAISPYEAEERARSPPTARPSPWERRIRCSSSTPPDRPESRRACCTPPAATWLGPRGPTRRCSTIGRARCSGAPPTWVG